MFELFTQSARRVLFFARYEAGLAGSVYVDPHHLLLALTREQQPVLTRVFQKLGIDELPVRATLGRTGTSTSRPSSFPLSDDVKKILAYAMHEAEGLEHNAIGPEHLLLGVLQSGGVAKQFLEQNGVEIGFAREVVKRVWLELNVATTPFSDVSISVHADHAHFIDRLVSGIRAGSGENVTPQILLQVMIDSIRQNHPDLLETTNSLKELLSRLGPNRPS